MIADGVLKGVRIERGGPIDKLLHQYMSGHVYADILLTYANNLPPHKQTVAIIGDAIKSKYPFYDNSETAKLDELEKYNKAIKLAKRIAEMEREKRYGKF